MEASVTGQGVGRGRVAATLSGLSNPELRATTVSATVLGADGPVVVALRPTGPATGRNRTRTDAADIAVPPGAFVPVQVAVAGPRARSTLTGVTTVDGSADLLGVTGDRLTPADGEQPASLEVDVAVQARLAGPYQLAVDLVGPDGQQIVSAPGAAELTEGRGTITVQVPVDRLVSAGVDGPYRLVDATLTRGTSGRTLVAEVADLGATSAVDTAAIPVGEIIVGPAAFRPADGDGDRLLDELTFAGTVHVPEDGEYRVSAQLVGPTGAVVDEHEMTTALAPGGAAVTLSFDGNLVGEHGPGRYLLTGYTVAAAADAQRFGEGPPASPICSTPRNGLGLCPTRTR